MSVFGRSQDPFEPSGDDEFALGLGEQEQLLVKSLVSQLRTVLRTEAADPTTIDEDSAVRRLFPVAYADDPDRQDGYAALVHDDLVAHRLKALDVVEETVMLPTLAGEHLDPWMTALNDLRLALGTRLDVSEEADEVDPDDPDAPALAAYHYLGWLLEHLVRTQASLL